MGSIRTGCSPILPRSRERRARRGIAAFGERRRLAGRLLWNGLEVEVMRSIRSGAALGAFLLGPTVTLLACSQHVAPPAPAPAPSASSIITAPQPTTTPTTSPPSGGDLPLLPGEDPSGGDDGYPPYSGGGTPPSPSYPPPSPSTPPGYPPGYGSCSVQTGSQACDACLQQGCCAQLSACQADPSCGAVDTCAAQCYQQYANNPQIGEQCEDQCYNQYPSGGQKLDAVYECMDQACYNQCPE
jgi:hypothetical protein